MRFSRQYKLIKEWCPEPDLLLDIGANQGESILSFRNLWPDCRIISFEPRPTAWPILEAVAEADGNTKVRMYGLSDVKESRTITEYPQNFGGSSLLRITEYYQHSREWTGKSRPLQVALRTLDEESLPDFQSLVIKVDVEGFADRVIAGGKTVFSRAAAAIIEVCWRKSRFVDGATQESITPAMEGLGFRNRGNSRIVYSPDDFPEWCDSVWLKK